MQISSALHPDLNLTKDAANRVHYGMRQEMDMRMFRHSAGNSSGCSDILKGQSISTVRRPPKPTLTQIEGVGTDAEAEQRRKVFVEDINVTLA
ncbi:unnamed protein product [Soboliphyme baturini]|uniref:CACTA en-spm transposon protein n=1 Tax=Soboliphyme baturini TaxID=241478 RepID=A0A183IX08_9BILA|nr:unnamed protein product [Soboliphyme baturini]